MQWHVSRVYLYYSVLIIDDQLRELRGITVYTVGPATALAIAKLHFSTIVGADTGNGGALSDLIVQTFRRDHSLVTHTPHPSVEEEENVDTIPQLPLLFLVGDKRRDIIPKRLAEENIPLKELTVYETTIASTFEEELDHVLNETTDGDIEWIIFFSPSGAEIALEKLGKIPHRIKIATIGPTTEEYLRQKWNLVPDMVSAKPDPISMVQGILRHIEPHE
jgi:uroporphyrinogen-III synthase